MRELILVRHAKSDWGDAALADHDRPLNARGRRDAPVMADRLASLEPQVDRLLSSTALRARTTAAEFSAALGTPVELDPELYLAPAETLLEKAIAAQAGTIVIVAHDPGLSELAHLLSGGVIDHMPTCAVARFTWQAGATSALGSPADTWTRDTPRQHH